MAGFSVPGPVLLYAGIGGTRNQRQALFVGTSQGDVQVTQQIAKIPVYNSVGGRTFPTDELYDGEIHFISFILNRVDPSLLYQMLMSAPDPYSGSPVVAGTTPINMVGTLYGTEGYSFPFWLVFPYAAKFPGTPVGRRYWHCSVESPTTVDFGAKEVSPSVIIKAMRAWTTSTDPLSREMVQSNQFTPAFKLYDSNVAGLPAPN